MGSLHVPHRRAHVAPLKGTSGPIKEWMLYDSTYMKAAKLYLYEGYQEIEHLGKNLTNTEINPELYIFF